MRALLKEVADPGYRIRESKNAAEGLKSIREREPDCVLLDIHLPDKQGLGFLQQLTHGTPALCCPVVIMTGSDDRETSTTALRYGAQDFLPKSSMSAELLNRVIKHAIVRFALTRQTEAAISARTESEALLRLAQDVAGIGTFNWNLETGETSFGGAYFELYGLPADHPPLSFEGWLDLVEPADREFVRAETRRAIEGEREFRYDYRVTWPDGTRHWILARGAVLYSDAGRPTRLTGVNVDFTDVKIAQEALQAANEELLEFANTAGHDLQAPLRTVNLFTQVLERALGSNADPNVEDAVTHIRSGVHKMQLLVSNLLSFAQSGTVRESPARVVTCEESLKSALEDLDSDLQRSAATVTWDPLPAAPAYGDELARVFQNLIGNAIKYRRPDVAPAIHVTCTRRLNDWLLAVKDNGEGFDMVYAASIFRPFHRLANNVPGSGLGLAICRRIIERQGGQIWAHAVSGVGATFFFTLPALDAGESVPPADEQSSPDRSATRSSAGQ